MRLIAREILRELNDPKRIGLIGERVLSNVLNGFFGRENVFKNLYLKSFDQKITEIDAVAINKFGIFVFEMKNYSGIIYGSKDDAHFVQKVSANKTYKIVNSYNQNAFHINVLKDALSLNNNLFHSVIIYSDHCRLRLEDIPNIIQLRELKLYLNKFNQELLDNEKIINIKNQIDVINQDKEKLKKLKNLQDKKDNLKEKRYK